MRGAALLLVTAIAAPAAGAGSGTSVEPEIGVVWLDADGGEISEDHGAIGVFGVAGVATGAAGSPARFRLVMPDPSQPPSVRLTIASVPAAGGRDRDALRGVPLEPIGDGRLATPWLVAVASLEDLRDPGLAGRALRVRVDDRVEARVRRGGGRAHRSSRAVTLSAADSGSLALRRVELEVVVLRRGPGGPPVAGGDEAGAVSMMRFQAEVLNEVLAPCAVWVGAPAELPVRVVEPSPTALIAIGDPLGLPSGGGEVRLEIDGRRLPSLKVGSGYEPAETARILAAHVRQAGLRALVSQNALNPFAVYATVDVVVRRADGAPATVRPWEGSPVTTDRRQPIRVGGMELGVGIDARGPNDFASGTIQERALVKVLGSDRPGPIRIFVVDGLGAGRKQGEAFPRSAGPALGDTVIMDWRAFRNTRQAFALPHEVVHLLLGDLGHPDAAGDRRPELLMHSRASSAVDGPRRLTGDQCGVIRRGLEQGVSSSSGT
ncbi:MAG TPA: hypothetical protein VM285_16230 [Polyangia bacterium]|nr:hypothetical protein [Polyangia bacterium]